MKQKRSVWIVASVLLVMAAVAWFWVGKEKAAVAPAATPLSVRVAPVRVQDVPQVLEAVGKVVPSASVEVRPQTGGLLTRVLIADGARVKAGQPLFELDPQPLNTALAQAQAQWQRDKALAADALASETRLKPLAQQGYVSALEFDMAVNSRTSLAAAAEATRTQIDQARINLAYASIRAPISGVAGEVLVKQGNLLVAGATTPLVTINTISPIELAFALPQQQLAALRAQQRLGQAIVVEARDNLSKAVTARGELVFVDNQVNDASGTIAVKARFANTDEALWPGAFFAVRVILKTDVAAITIPEQALQQGQAGAYVYVFDEGKARLRQVVVARVLDGLAVVSKGLKGGDTVLVSIPNNLRDGSAVTVATAP
ncbi:efflux RND transporter periplasmic adaptor subunit [uncultured Nevskia sp.]|uniref:efflux RND transporter periplasmic adaptor subunit n=1 Tax=uncultured Nevskia sp. TaxID=228950 RepID=UPI0025D8F64B|nr:efflux RND transporter periplasmic adaptor subunit [uncultured Nevskia sp.]